MCIHSRITKVSTMQDVFMHSRLENEKKGREQTEEK